MLLSRKFFLYLIMKQKLLSRTEFKASVFKRDKFTCVFCDKPACDTHHILDRALWSDGGYYLNNGASVCEAHHWDCERTTITVKEVYQTCGITDIILPEGFDSTQSYDKWGNIMLPDGMRKPGPMFHTDGVQKIFKNKMYIFILN